MEINVKIRNVRGRRDEINQVLIFYAFFGLGKQELRRVGAKMSCSKLKVNGEGANK